MNKFIKIVLAALSFYPSLATAQHYPNTNCVSVTPVIDTAAYATGDYMGAAVLTFTGALRSNTNTGYIVSVEVTDKAAQAVDLDVVIFTDNPTSTTFTDNAAFAPAAGDLTKIAGVVNLGSSSRFAFSANSVHFIGSLAIPVQGGRVAGLGTSTLYGALVARGAYDGASASDVTVILCLSQD